MIETEEYRDQGKTNTLRLEIYAKDQGIETRKQLILRHYEIDTN